MSDARRSLLSSALVALALGVAALGCDEGSYTTIDARRDAGVGDLGALDGGVDAGDDAGSLPDASCAPAPAPYDVVDTGGPSAESQAACEGRVGASFPGQGPMGQRFVAQTLGSVDTPLPLSCGGQADGLGSYASRSQVYGCGQRLRVVDAARGSCFVVEAASAGPHVCAEERAGAAVIDLSPAVADVVLGASTLTVDEGVEVLVAPVANTNPLGACDHTDEPAAVLAGFIGGPCNEDVDCAFTGGVCQLAADGYPGGHCTRACTTSCPDLAGPYAFTGCAAPDDTLRCYARCDFTLFASGCRQGYGCFTEAAPGAGGVDRDVCLPLLCGP